MWEICLDVTGVSKNKAHLGNIPQFRIYTYKRVVCVCLCVCLSAFYRPHDICPICGTPSEYSDSSQAVAGGPARAGKRMHSDLARARARMPNNFSTKLSLC